VIARPYQAAAKAAIYAKLRKERSTLLVLPTGTGKTIVFADVAADAVKKGCRVLILAHTSELIEQAADKLLQFKGIEAGIEMAARKTGREGALLGAAPPVVVASWQSMIRRLDRFPPDYFGLVIIDEAHRAVGRSYAKLIDYFCDAKLLGVTATTGRGDKRALGLAFDSVAFKYEIVSAIDDGWLIPIVQRTVDTPNLNLSKCRVTAGDLNMADVEAVMVESSLLEDIAGPTVSLVGSRQTIIFAVTVKHAYLLAEVIFRHLKDKAVELGTPPPSEISVQAIDGKTDKDRRKKIIDDFREGRCQFIINASMLIEGFDVPAIGAVVMASPTKSILRYTQMLGRGTRPLGGVVDIHDTPEARKSAIASSDVPDLLVLDFSGNSGKHDLAGVVDALGGNWSPAIKSITARALKKNGGNVLEALAAARSYVDEKNEAIARHRSRSQYVSREVDPFIVLGAPPSAKMEKTGPASEAQIKALNAAGVNVKEIDGNHANFILHKLRQRRNKKLCSYKQAKVLIRSGLDEKRVMKMRFTMASTMLTQLAANNWIAPASWRIPGAQ